MTTLALAQTQLITFPMLDSGGLPVPGLSTGFALSVSKNGGAFAASAGVKAEIGSGWYSYELTASETDTEGPLAIKATGAGAVQQNLAYQVSGSIWDEPAGVYILTATEAATVLRCATDDPDMLALLPLVDQYIHNATGHNWAADATIQPAAKAAARMLLVMWHENPAMLANGITSLNHGLVACLSQLEALALRYRNFEGLPGAGLIRLLGAREGDIVSELVGLVGASGDQSANFESVITYNNHIRQISSSNLDETF